jgi:hypothetical protein
MLTMGTHIVWVHGQDREERAKRSVMGDGCGDVSHACGHSLDSRIRSQPRSKFR